MSQEVENKNVLDEVEAVEAPVSEFAGFDDEAEKAKEEACRQAQAQLDAELPPDPNAILEVRHLKKHFVLKKTLLGKPLSTLKAVDDVSIKVNPGDTSKNTLQALT